MPQPFEYRRECIFCNKTCTIPNLDADRYARWKQGTENIQEVFPELTPAQRELLVSGVCEECFNQTCLV